jgi:uncharacterized protein YidB (DUF937 family)
VDDLSKMLGGLSEGGSDPATALNGLASAVQDEGGLDDLIGKLQQSGAGGAVDTWIAGGPNEPIDPNQIQTALGDDEVQRLASKSGIDVATLLPLLAAFLPQIINMLTPNGQVPSGGLNQAAQENMPDLGGLLGGMAGGSGSSGSGGLGDILGGMTGMLGGGGQKPQ